MYSNLSGCWWCALSTRLTALLYIAFSSFQGVAQGDMKNSSENLQPWRSGCWWCALSTRLTALLYIAFSSFQGVAQGDMKNSSENPGSAATQRGWRCLACSALHYLARRASQGN